MLQTTHLELGQYVFLPGLDKCYHQFIKMVQVVVYRPSYELAGAFGREARPKHKSSIAYQKNASLFLPLEKKHPVFVETRPLVTRNMRYLVVPHINTSRNVPYQHLNDVRRGMGPHSCLRN